MNRSVAADYIPAFSVLRAEDLDIEVTELAGAYDLGTRTMQLIGMVTMRDLPKGETIRDTDVADPYRPATAATKAFFPLVKPE